MSNNCQREFPFKKENNEWNSVPDSWVVYMWTERETWCVCGTLKDMLASDVYKEMRRRCVWVYVRTTCVCVCGCREEKKGRTCIDREEDVIRGRQCSGKRKERQLSCLFLFFDFSQKLTLFFFLFVLFAVPDWKNGAFTRAAPVFQYHRVCLCWFV